MNATSGRAFLRILRGSLGLLETWHRGTWRAEVESASGSTPLWIFGHMDGVAMQFRWAMFISLWTLLSGPAFDSSGPSSQHGPRPSISASSKVSLDRSHSK
jgi:hypothetical protein